MGRAGLPNTCTRMGKDGSKVSGCCCLRGDESPARQRAQLPRGQWRVRCTVRGGERVRECVCSERGSEGGNTRCRVRVRQRDRLSVSGPVRVAVQVTAGEQESVTATRAAARAPVSTAVNATVRAPESTIDGAVRAVRSKYVCARERDRREMARAAARALADATACAYKSVSAESESVGG